MSRSRRVGDILFRFLPFFTLTKIKFERIEKKDDIIRSCKLICKEESTHSAQNTAVV